MAENKTTQDKQIEEMAKIMLEASTTANVEPVLEMEGKEVVLGENATKVLNSVLEQAFIPFLAEVLYNAGYRKASEIAMEIFGMLQAGGIDEWRYPIVADIKKKYTEGEDKK